MSTRFQLHVSAFGFADIQHPCNVIAITALALSFTMQQGHHRNSSLLLCVNVETPVIS
jgi:hypothetical protein